MIALFLSFALLALLIHWGRKIDWGPECEAFTKYEVRTLGWKDYVLRRPLNPFDVHFDISGEMVKDAERFCREAGGAEVKCYHLMKEDRFVFAWEHQLIRKRRRVAHEAKGQGE